MDDDQINRRQFVRAAGAVGAGVALPGAAAADQPDAGPRVEANVREDVPKPTATRTFPVLDEEGNEIGERTWRTVKETGNCCENYLAASPDGRLFDMGGDYLRVTDDFGRTWNEVEPPNQPYPILTSEGAVTAAPGGDVVAVDWDPYSPDRVISYKYEADDETWYYTEVPLKTPFYDRPWMAVIPGPFELGGESLPYLTVMRGGVVGDQELYVSLDGLNYHYASTRFVDSLVQGSVEDYLDPSEDGILDWVQPHTETYLVPLGDGRALGDETAAQVRASFAESGCEVTALGVGDGPGPTDEFQWSCFDTPRGFELDRTQVDSRGWIHQVEFVTAATFEYRVSRDGGESWDRYEQELPGEFELSEGALSLYDFTVHGGLDTTAVAIHATRDGESSAESPTEPAKEAAPEPVEEAIEAVESNAPGREDPDEPDDQDMVYVFEGLDDGDPSVEIRLVGAADMSYVSGVSTSERFDFPTVAVLPDGRLAMSFADQADENPMVAIEVADDVETEFIFEPEGSRSDDGTAFDGGQTNRVELAFTPVLIPDADESFPVRDSIPASWSVPGDQDAVARVEETDGRTYVHFDADAPANDEYAVTYYVETPDEPGESGPYTLGPAQVERDGAWVDVAGTTDDNVVVGQQV